MVAAMTDLKIGVYDSKFIGIISYVIRFG